MSTKITTRDERDALVNRAITEVANSTTQITDEVSAQARLADILHTEYGFTEDRAKLTAYEWYGSFLARYELSAQMEQLAAASDDEQEAFRLYSERLTAFWHGHRDIATAEEAEKAYSQAFGEMASAISDAFYHDGDMETLYADTRLSEDFLNGLACNNPLHWRVVTRALAGKDIPGVTAATLAQANSMAREAVISAIEDANETAHESADIGEAKPVAEQVRELREARAEHRADDMTVMEFPAAEQRQKLGRVAVYQRYLEDVVYPELEARVAQQSPDGTVRRDALVAEIENWSAGRQDEAGFGTDIAVTEWMRRSRYAHTLRLEPDGFVAEWGAFGIGNPEVEAEGTVYDVLQ